jgi:Cu(I)/Ag(I) efflux system membrane fusion protein
MPAARATQGAQGLVFVSPQRQQQIGVRYATVERRHLLMQLRAVARVTYNEKALATIAPKIGGWIEKLYVNFTGERVKKGQRLLDIYSPELLATQEEYLVALRAKRELGKSPYPSVAGGGEALLQATRRRLELWDISRAQIERLEKSGRPTKTLSLYSPFTGYVVEKEALEGMEVRPGMALYRIANLSTVWVEADYYEYEVPYVQVGQRAKARLAYLPGEVLAGKVTYIYPYLNEETRTVRVRMEFPNPKLRLKPGMYANVNLDVDLGDRLAVPSEALLDTGTRKIAFVDRGRGYLEPREVQAGAKAGDYYVVERGLQLGERVVTSANFLIASESKLKEAMGGMAHGGH